MKASLRAGPSRRPQKPTIPAVIAMTPTPERPSARAMEGQVPSISSSGVATNRNGMMKAAQPTRIAATPVLSGSSMVIVAAAKAASATGGVIIDIMPK